MKFKDFLKDQPWGFNAMAVLGSMYLAYNVLYFMGLVYKHTCGKCIHKKPLKRGTSDWAIVTGGSDGIGLAIAK